MTQLEQENARLLREEVPLNEICVIRSFSGYLVVVFHI